MKLTRCKRTIIALLLSMASAYSYADNSGRGISYSHDQWPSRWSHAIQQQSGAYPSRTIENTPPPELPTTFDREVSGQDLFYSPSLDQFRQQRPSRSVPRQTQYYRDNKNSTYSNESRKAAFAYYGMRPLAPHAGYAYPGFDHGFGNVAMDPVLGHPGIGIPIMPGVPYGYPLMGYSPVIYPGMGYPGSFGMWNPPFGAW